MSKESKFVCQLIVAIMFAPTFSITVGVAGNPERPPELDAPVDLATMPIAADAMQDQTLQDQTPQKAIPQNEIPERDLATAQSSKDAVKVIKQIYAQTKTAKTAKEFSAIVLACESALEPPLNLSTQHQSDLKGLLAWALSRRGQERVDLAVSLRAAGNRQQFTAILEASLADFNQSIEADASRWKTFFGRSIALANLDQTDKAIQDLNKAIKLKPKSKKARFNRAELLNWKGDADSVRAAIEDYNFVLAATPKDVQAINGLAHAQLALGNIDQAIELYTRVTQLQPNNSVAWQARGEAYQAAANWKAASVDFARSISIQKSAQSYRKAAWLYSTCPDPDFFEPITAMQYAQAGKKIDPDSVESLEVLAAASAANGEFDSAVDLQKQAIKKTASVQAGYQFDTDEMKIRLASYEQEQPYLQVK